MNKPRVNYEQAVRLKAVWYDVPTRHVYNARHKEVLLNFEESNVDLTDNYSRPTLDDVCRWLREVHWLHVTVDLWQIDLDTDPIQNEWRGDIANMDDREDSYNYISGTYSTHDLAQSAAIDDCLTIIEERKKKQQ